MGVVEEEVMNREGIRKGAVVNHIYKVRTNTDLFHIIYVIYICNLRFSKLV